MNLTPSAPNATVNRDAPRINRFSNCQALADAIALRVASAVAQGITRHGRASLIFSGGTTPEMFLPHLATQPLQWEKVNVLLSDERWVDEDSPHSNAAMLRRIFLTHPGAAAARFIPLKNTATTAADGLALTRQNLPPLDQPYDLVLLGMGEDGHIASLFPGDPHLESALAAANSARVVAVPAPTTAQPSVERVSLTLAELKRSLQMVLVLKGPAKLAALQQAWRVANPLLMPVYALGAIDVMWCP